MHGLPLMDGPEIKARLEIRCFKGTVAGCRSMSLRLVKRQLAALSKSQAAQGDSLQPGEKEEKSKKPGKILKNKINKDKQKKPKKIKKAIESRDLSKEEIRQRNLQYFKRTCNSSEKTDVMMQASDLSLAM
jgi:hypothetical protein